MSQTLKRILDTQFTLILHWVWALGRVGHHGQGGGLLSAGGLGSEQRGGAAVHLRLSGPRVPPNVLRVRRGDHGPREPEALRGGDHSPSSRPGPGRGGTAAGSHWSLPYSLAPGRQYAGRNGARYTVYDVVFHPEALALARSHERFREMLDATALEAVEQQFGVRLDRRNAKTHIHTATPRQRRRTLPARPRPPLPRPCSAQSPRSRAAPWCSATT